MVTLFSKIMKKVWVNAYFAPYNSTVMFSKGHDTKREAITCRKRGTMTYIGVPIPIMIPTEAYNKKLVEHEDYLRMRFMN